MFVVHCGAGNQKLKWLGDVAIHRYDPNFAMETGLAKEIRFENGVILNTEGVISDELQDDIHVYVILKGKNLIFENDIRGHSNAGSTERDKKEEMNELVEKNRIFIIINFKIKLWNC